MTDITMTDHRDGTWTLETNNAKAHKADNMDEAQIGINFVEQHVVHFFKIAEKAGLTVRIR